MTRDSKNHYVIEMTSADDILMFLKQLKEMNFKSFPGICWFRLPKDSDEFNWSIQTLAAVLEGRRPQLKMTTEVDRSKEGLTEIYLVNQGEQNLIRPVNIELTVDQKNSLFYDVLGDFHEIPSESGKGVHIQGPAPRAGQKKLIAWLRSVPYARNQLKPISVGDVNIE